MANLRHFQFLDLKLGPGLLELNLGAAELRSAKEVHMTTLRGSGGGAQQGMRHEGRQEGCCCCISVCVWRIRQYGTRTHHCDERPQLVRARRDNAPVHHPAADKRHTR